MIAPASLPAVGSVAPDFSLKSTSGATVSLGDYRGKSNVLIAFFPLAFTGTCSAEVCEFSDDTTLYQGANTVVLPISVDSIPTLKAFMKYEHVTVDMLSDFKREVSRKYGALDEEKFQTGRAYVLVDRDGTVRWTHVEADSSQKRTTDELMQQIRAIS
jgi:peroxiredoxin